MTILDTLLTEHFDKELTKHQRKKVLLSTLRHLLRIDSSSKNKSALRDVYGRDARVIGFQAELSNRGYLLKNLKLYLLAMAHQEFKTSAHLIKWAKAYKITLEDAKLIWMLKKDNGSWKQLQKLCSKVEKPITLREMDDLLVQVNSQLFTYTAKFAGKKLRFATLGSHLRIEDIASELRLLGIQGLMKAYPAMDNELHALNIAKRTIHNQGINLIFQYTSQRNSVLVKGDDGTFTSLKVSLDVFDESTGPSDCSLVTSIDGSLTTTGDTESDLCVTYHKLLKKYRGREKKFIKLLSGTYSGSFTRWLSRNTRYTEEQNDDLFVRLQRRGAMTRYIKLVSEFLDFSNKESAVFLTELREVLA
ncbi:hypothetical protein GR7B_00103 [Vibrio phage vB_VcorM_GR7B]|nr:hypothetical protein GR7B_00103 [Vibrio phage vB_VcorM_GR7B]